MAHPHRIAPAWSHNSAPDVILAAVSQRTTPLRVEVVLAPIRPPLHIAAPMAPLDMLSPGRVDVGLGCSGRSSGTLCLPLSGATVTWR
jgi:alkanesulfonate monooxygenase SsuD/methylene tetrahydromethanopterin reductase-like flavin-dependent oxidoreductase (luciferase family)